MPERLLAASAAPAQASRIPAGGSAAPAARAEYDRMANAIRALAMDAVEQAKSGHPGLPMGAADIATVLFTRFLKFDPADPAWPDRDRFVLSAGHGSMLLYALLHLLGYEAMTIDEIKRFRQLGSITPGHPERGHTAGVETTTGPLGQGLANAVGMAIAERHLAAEFGADIVDHSTYVLASDGDLMEGISQEAIALAGHLKLNKLIVLFDDNGISIDGPTSLADNVDQVKRFEAAGFAATRIDGHDPAAIAAALEAAKKSERPSLIACHTTIGFGAPTKAGKASSHGSALGADEIEGARENLGWSYPPFEIPTAIREAWRAAGARGKPARTAWEQRLAALAPEKRGEFTRRARGELSPKLAAAVRELKQNLAAAPKEIASRSASEFALEALTVALPEMIGGSADLTGSNNTRTKAMKAMSAADYSAFIASLQKKFAGEPFLIMRYGDHQPEFSPHLLDPGLDEGSIGKKLERYDPRYFATYYAIDAVNFEPVQSPVIMDMIDGAYLPLVIQEAAGIPLDPSFAEQKEIMLRCSGVFYACKNGAEARRFNALLIDAGLIHGL